MVNEVFRGDEKVHEGSVEVWEYDQQSNAVVVQEPFEIHAGDTFRTTCYYRADNDAKFGLSSQDEMCIAFLFYYPRKQLAGRFPWMCGVGLPGDVCTAAHDHTILDSTEALGRQFGDVTSPIRDCSAPESTGGQSDQPSSTSGSRSAIDRMAVGLLLAVGTMLLFF